MLTFAHYSVPSTALTDGQRLRLARRMLKALKPRFTNRKALLDRLAAGRVSVPADFPVIVVEAGEHAGLVPDLASSDVMPERLADHLESLTAERIALVTLPDMQRALNRLAGLR